jgi:hypothetical protein
VSLWVVYDPKCQARDLSSRTATSSRYLAVEESRRRDHRQCEVVEEGEEGFR